MNQVRLAASQLAWVLRNGVQRGVTPGYCPVCQRRTIFCKEGTWLRDQFKCARCFSIPRWRAVIDVLETFFPDWRDLAVHESSPSGAASQKIARECRRCVQTFPDASFDLVISQDVFEHVLDPARGFAEVARTLKPGGAHVFTIPWYYWKPTLVRAARDGAGGIRHYAVPEYHGNPIDASGSLVVTEWGADFCDFVFRASGLTTTAIRIRDRTRGIDGKFIEVFISRKAMSEVAGPPPA